MELNISPDMRDLSPKERSFNLIHGLKAVAIKHLLSPRFPNYHSF